MRRFSTDVPAPPRLALWVMHFRVERERGGIWHEITSAIEANSAAQAVARACSDAGRYRAGPHGSTDEVEHFVVPAWGPPEPVEEDG